MRQSISNHYYSMFDGIKVDPNSLIIATGSKELIYLAMRVFNGTVILNAPAWGTYSPQVNLANKKCMIIRTTQDSNWKVTPEQLERELGRRNERNNKLLIFNNPGNPS